MWMWAQSAMVGSRVDRESVSLCAQSQTRCWLLRVGRELFPDVCAEWGPRAGRESFSQVAQNQTRSGSLAGGESPMQDLYRSCNAFSSGPTAQLSCGSVVVGWLSCWHSLLTYLQGGGSLQPRTCMCRGQAPLCQVSQHLAVHCCGRYARIVYVGLVVCCVYLVAEGEVLDFALLSHSLVVLGC